MVMRRDRHAMHLVARHSGDHARHALVVSVVTAAGGFCHYSTIVGISGFTGYITLGRMNTTATTLTTVSRPHGETVMQILGAVALVHLLNDLTQAMLPSIYPMLKASLA
jgi:hypothetical protein